MRRGGSLTVVGLGLRAIGHVTAEADRHIGLAERFYYLASNPLMLAWVSQRHPAGITLVDLYAEGKPRTKTYEDMADRVLGAVREGHRVVAAFYGHPGVGATPAHDMIRRARAEGYPARMLPGVSADGCLYADVGVDPLTPGMQSFEAWMFLEARARIDTRFALVLWQVGLIYQRSVSFDGIAVPHGLRDLARRLKRSYPGDHEVVVYEAATLPIGEPRIERRPLSQLADATVSPATTLYVPPLAVRATPKKRPVSLDKRKRAV